MGFRQHLHAVPSSSTHGPIENSLSGVVTALTELREWKNVLAMNELSRRMVFRKEPPYLEGQVTGRPLADRDFDRIRLWFEDSRRVKLSKRTLVEGARIVATWNAFHPVREYLEALEWDGKSRLSTWLEDYCAVVPSSESQRTMVRAVARKWMIACAARALEPGCKVDSMLILEGRQGIGKSTALKVLAGSGFYCDTPLDLGSSQACQSIQGVWIYEIPELSALLRGNPAHGKAFLTSASDHFCTPYGRIAETVPRSVVFCGTVNHGGYLRDMTGNRRFWVIRCEDTLRTRDLATARDSLWAEACHQYKEGQPWHLTPEEEALMAAEQEGRVAIDPWQEPISTWIEHQGNRPFTMTELLEGALQLRASATSPSVTTRVSALLEASGYERKRSPKPPRTYTYVRTVRDDVHPSICPTGGEDLFPREGR
jgi:putative DNA primase/helicase